MSGNSNEDLHDLNNDDGGRTTYVENVTQPLQQRCIEQALQIHFNQGNNYINGPCYVDSCSAGEPYVHCKHVKGFWSIL